MARRKKKKLEAEPILQEFDGWSVGDIVWGIRPNKAVCRGEIIRFYESEMLAQILCIEGDGYLICELKTLEEKSTKSIMKKKAKDYNPGK